MPPPAAGGICASMCEAAEMSVGRNSVVLAVMVGVTLCTLQMLRPKALLPTHTHTLQPTHTTTTNTHTLQSNHTTSTNTHTTALQPEVNDTTTVQGWVGAWLKGTRGEQLFALASSFGIAHSTGAHWCVPNLEQSVVSDLIVYNDTPPACPTAFQVVSDHSFHSFYETELPFSLAHSTWAQQWVSSRHIQVGIHVRRAGASIHYFENAIQRLLLMTQKNDFKFVVCTDDLAWVQAQPLFANMTVASDNSPGQDLAILAACQHVIMSVGTFGWWANYLKHDKEGYSIYFQLPHEPEGVFPSTWIPVSNTKEHFISLVVPFRQRDQHRLHFLQHWQKRMPLHVGEFTMLIYFVRQANTDPFNRARLFNIGLKTAMGHSQCVVVHDIDMIPDGKVNYTDCVTPIQLSSEVDSWGNSVAYPTYTGGVVSATPAHWRHINGMSNKFVGWGGEDDELYHRLKYYQLLDTSTGFIRRPAKGGGAFHTLNDEHHTPRETSAFYNDMVRLIERASRGEVNFAMDGLSTNTDIPTIHRMQKLSENLFTTDITCTCSVQHAGNTIAA